MKNTKTLQATYVAAGPALRHMSKLLRIALAMAQLASALGGAVIGVTQPAALSTLTGTPRQARADVNSFEPAAPPLASLRLVKQVVGSDSASTFPATVQGPTGTLNVNLTAGTPVVLEDLTPGTYTVTEGTLPAAPAGYQWTGVAYEPTQTISLAAGQTTAVTITNMLGYTATAPSGVLTVTKVVANGGSSGPYRVTITGPNGYVSNTTITSGTNSFSGLAQGVYTITEDSPGTGWVVTYTVDAVSNTSNAVVTLTNASPYAAFSVGTITGTVYNDYNSDGQMTADGVVTDTGVQSVTVTVYDVTGAIAGTATPDADGRYTVNVSSSGPYRVEFSALPADYEPARSNSGAGTSVQFITAANQAAGMNFGVLRACDYCQTLPGVFFNHYVGGDQVAGPNNMDAVMSMIPYTSGGTTPATAYQPPTTTLALANELGATWGLGYQRSTRTIYAGTYFKYRTGYGPGGQGAIYAVNAGADGQLGTTDDVKEEYANLNTVFGAGTTGSNPFTTTGSFGDINYVGKVEFGDVDVAENDKTLYVTNLNDRKVYQIPLNGPVSAADVIVSPAVPTSADCAVADDVRPFALAPHRGKVFVGGVCSFESLGAYTSVYPTLMVWEYDPIANTMSAPVFTYTMSYTRAGLGSWGGWSAQYRSHPMLTDIVFDGEDMILATRERRSDQNNFATGVGDILRACANGAGGWTMESGGACGGQVTNWGTNSGPGGQEYYYDHNAEFNEGSNGGLALRPGTDVVLNTTYDHYALYVAGVTWYDTATGGQQKSYNLRLSPFDITTIDGKQNAVGDVELLCDPAPIEIGNRVWDDLDGDGMQDPGEPSLAGITLTLSGPDGMLTTMTDLNGQYVFTRSATSGAYTQTLRPETLYAITLITPAGYTMTVPNAGNVTSNHAISDVRDSDAYLTVGGQPTIFHVTGEMGQNNHGLDFGLVRGVSADVTVTNTAPAYDLGNRVWFDTNNDGLLNGSELPVASAAMQLRNSAGTVIANTTTNASGYYSFTNLAPGTYSVIVAASNFAAGGALDGYWSSTGALSDVITTGNNLDHGVDPATYAAYLANGVSSGPLTLGSGLPTGEDPDATATPNGDAANNLTIDFGFYKLEVGNQVWEDLNNNGLADVGEQSLANVPVAILDGSGNVVSTTLTDASGLYTFTGLLSGTYVISITPPAGYVSSSGQALTDGADYTDHGAPSGTFVVSTPFDLTPGDEPVVDNSTGSSANPNLDFGLWYPAALGNYVWRDDNRDGVQNEAPNAGLNGVTVTLYVSTTRGGWAPISSTVTANDPLGNPGYYTFTHLVSGTYQVVFDLNTLPAGATVTAQDSVTGTDALDSDADALTGVTVPVTLFPGDVNPTIDMGVIMPAGLGDTVWLDVDHDGQQDAGEPPVQGVTVTLYMSGTPVSTTVTNGSGYYEFVLLTPGVPYSVSFTLPTGYTWTLPTTGDSAMDSNADAVTGATGTVILQPGEFNPTIDAGIWTPPTASVTKTTLNPGTVRPQQQINYQIVVRNTGVTLAQNVVISDPVPAGTSYVAGSASPAATLTNGVIVWPPVNLMPGQAVTVTMSVSVNTDLGGVTVITNVAQVDNVQREIEIASNQVVNPLDPTAITLDAFSAQLGERGVTVAWRTTLERETLGYNVLRSMTGSRADAVRVNTALIAAQGANGGSYSVVDASGVAGARYWIEEIELSGAVNLYGPTLVASPGLDAVTQTSTRLEVRPGGVAIVAAGAGVQPVLASEASVNGQSVVGGNTSVIEPHALPGEAGVNGPGALPGEAGVGGHSVLGGEAGVAAPSGQPANAGASVASADTNQVDANVANADSKRVDVSITSVDTGRANSGPTPILPWGALVTGAMLGLSVLGAGAFALRRKKHSL